MRMQFTQWAGKVAALSSTVEKYDAESEGSIWEQSGDEGRSVSSALRRRDPRWGLSHSDGKISIAFLSSKGPLHSLCRVPGCHSSSFSTSSKLRSSQTTAKHPYEFCLPFSKFFSAWASSPNDQRWLRYFRVLCHLADLHRDPFTSLQSWIGVRYIQPCARAALFENDAQQGSQLDRALAQSKNILDFTGISAHAKCANMKLDSFRKTNPENQ